MTTSNIKSDGHINFTKNSAGVILDVRMLMVVRHENQATIEIRLVERFGRYEVGYSFSSGRAASLEEMRAWNATLEEYGQLFELLADQLANAVNADQSVVRAVVAKYEDAIANHNYSVCFGG